MTNGCCASRQENPRYLASVLIEWSRVGHSVARKHYVAIQINGTRRVEKPLDVLGVADLRILSLKPAVNCALVL